MALQLTISHLRFRYATASEWVLQDVSLDLRGGEFVVIAGTSGAGKSTLLNCINGSAVVYGEMHGQIALNGVALTGQPVAQIARSISTVAQDAEGQIVTLRVEDEIAFGCENLGVTPEAIQQRITRSCALLDLNPDQATSTLSGGGQQRLITAAALAMGTHVILLDEPLANLDAVGTARLLDTLRDLASHGALVIVAEHRLDVILPYATRLIWIEDGRVTLDLPHDEALRYVQRLIRRMTVVSVPDRQMPSDIAIELDSVSAGYAAVPVLRDITLTVRQGEQIVVLGENGCGKTTLLRVIAGLLKPQRGRLRYGLDRLRPLSRRIGYVFQSPNSQLFMDSVRAEIAVQAESAELVDEVVSLFGLASLSDRHPQALSTGQKRLVAVAAMVAMRPDVLLLDEPSVGQDARGVERMLAALGALRQKWGLTLIVVTHDWRCASAFGERVIWINQGVIYRDGDASMLPDYFLHAYPCRDEVNR
jgi:energy-coupling factor transporter ATP-binding protein EcfA2